jgi:hypothetical protein
MPAGRPWRVMTISSSTANRRYFDRSSLISARATALGLVGWRPLPFEPRLRVGFRDDSEDLDLRFCNVIKHPDVAHSEAVLGLAQTPESFDAALADLCWVVREVQFEGLLDSGANRHRQVLQRGHCLRSQNDLKSQSGQIIARIVGCGNTESWSGGLTCQMSRASRRHDRTDR